MHIGIDGRLWNETGVGRYIRSLVRELGNIDSQNMYTLFLCAREYASVEVPNSRWSKSLADVPWHTLKEQLQMPGIYEREELDLVHIPYFSVPLMIRTPFIVTIHDLTISHFATGKATTRPMLVYLAKRLGYRFVLATAIKRAQKIIAVSETVKKQILDEYTLSADRVTVTYESGSLEQTEKKSVKTPDQYILYVGNAHPHKNLLKLVKAFQLLKDDFPKLQLVLVGNHDFFYTQLKKYAEMYNYTDRLILAGGVSNGELLEWYKKAEFFVFPSHSEGFGIPGLEAMSQGCRVAASDIAVFHEIYGEAAYYFNQKDPGAMAAAFKQMLTNDDLRKKLLRASTQKVTEYSWKKMAEETLSLYESSTRLRPRQ